MPAAINVFPLIFNQRLRAWFRNFVDRDAEQQALDTTRHAISPRFVPRRQPISAEMGKEIERLELAIRQGSVNAY